MYSYHTVTSSCVLYCYLTQTMESAGQSNVLIPRWSVIKPLKCGRVFFNLCSINVTLAHTNILSLYSPFTHTHIVTTSHTFTQSWNTCCEEDVCMRKITGVDWYYHLCSHGIFTNYSWCVCTPLSLVHAQLHILSHTYLSYIHLSHTVTSTLSYCSHGTLSIYRAVTLLLNIKYVTHIHTLTHMHHLSLTSIFLSCLVKRQVCVSWKPQL